MTITLLSLLSAFLACVAWNYRYDYLTAREAMSKGIDTLRFERECRRVERESLERAEFNSWTSYRRAFHLAEQADKARIAAEEHAKHLRTELDETKARLEAAERSQADTEIYAEEAGAVQAENRPGEMVRDY